MRLLGLLLLFHFSLQQVSLSTPLPHDVNTTEYIALHDSTNGQSPFLKGLSNREWGRRRRGCRFRPWICNPPGERGFRRRKRCCRNKCIDIYSNVNHCGFCRRRCRFGWSCCARRCIDTRFSRRNCGKCFNRCPRRVECYMGMCGYADGVTPSPDRPQVPDRFDGVTETETDIQVDDDDDGQEPDS